MKGYRFVTKDLKSEHRDVQWVVGEWQKCKGKLSLCGNGLHASKKPLDSLNYIFGMRWFECEAKGEILKDTDKFCASEMRLVREIPKEVIIQFAIDCAKKVLPIFEKQCPNDKRPREAIYKAQACLKNSSAAAWAASDAASDAARAASDAASAAAWAASDAARAAARAASDAARAAARAASAARAAAWAASDAARAAARAASDAARKWQNRHLLNLIKKNRESKEINE